jgi:HD-GYP domain-containing protein (c-di-GMP phosphodiesterase class II)
VAIYDPKTRVLKAFAHSSGGDDPLPHHQAVLDDVPSLKRLADERRPRVLNRIPGDAEARSEHARRLGIAGYRASYTVPMFADGEFFGFVFFDSHAEDVLSPIALAQLNVFGHLVTLMTVRELAALRTLSAAIESARHMVHARDTETGCHLDRMARYARLIARSLADRHGLDDETIERIQLYAPLHDIGKIGIPDAVLLKPGALSEDERGVMRGHPEKGAAIIEDLVANFGLGSLKDTAFLRNIALCHHECWDGSGYPAGLAGEAIPLEARIVSTADVFDALTSARPYKRAFTNDEAFEIMGRLAGTQLDPECVNALAENLAEIEAIQARFREDPLG